MSKIVKNLREWYCGPRCEEHCWHYDERNTDMFQQRQCCRCPRDENRIRSPQSVKGHGGYFKPQRTDKDPWSLWKQPSYTGP